jgi:L-rhamnose mutarotase
MRFSALLGLTVALGAGAPRAFAFTPYDAATEAGRTTRVGLLTAAAPGKGAELDQALKGLSEAAATRALKKHGISNLCIQKKVLGDTKTWYWAYFDYRGKDYLKAVNAFEAAAPLPAGLLQPHPRAQSHGIGWLQMEWICFLRGAPDAETPTKSKTAVVTRIKPEKEELYRTLHQTVWPGVADQIARSNSRNLSVFLVELGDEIYEFLYVEYIGNDAEVDGKSSKSDPCTLRWWKITDDCQLPLSDAKDSPWAGMDAVVP